MNNQLDRFKILSSEQDASVNFVADVDPSQKKAIEARFVQRHPSYFIAYLSSQTGCKQGCNMCHLTATDQTNAQDLPPEEFVEQLRRVLRYAVPNLEKTCQLSQVREINVNFMARGEPLANKLFAHSGEGKRISVLDRLSNVVRLEYPRPVALKFNISTIYPKQYKGKLSVDFSPYQPTFYYSIYSLDSDFRKKWLPAAQDPRIALDSFAEYQATTSKILKLHGAFIKGANDSIESLQKIVDQVNERGLICDFNLVRYNPYSEKYGQESEPEVLERNIRFLQANLKGTAKIITRVGFDVSASCGMFVE
jgi:23S rRNA (adenine2503-C2)-methyltransferase